MGLVQEYKFESRALYPELAGKRVVITGGASGIGKATAKRFVMEGARVVVFDFNDKAFEGDSRRHRCAHLKRRHLGKEELHGHGLQPMEEGDGREP